MTVYTYINENIDRIKADIRAGLMPCSILRHWEIYSRFDLFKRMDNNVVSSVFYTSEATKTCERTVYRIIKQMENEMPFN